MNQNDSLISRKYVINDNIVLKLESGKTKIFVGGKFHRICKGVLLNIPLNRAQVKENCTIEDYIDKFQITTYFKNAYFLTPLEEFFVHCSNIQAWVENDYDTYILSSNLSLSILKKLFILGDKTAIKIV